MPATASAAAGAQTRMIGTRFVGRRGHPFRWIGSARSINERLADGNRHLDMRRLETQISELRRRRRSFGFTAWLSSVLPIASGSSSTPDEADPYWSRVRRRLAEIDHAAT